ncbi:hypothetical protein DSECCO2_433520 [anaerobic digester metagenome]
MVGVAVNVTLVPAQMVDPGLAAIETLTGSDEFTVIVTVFDVAGLPVAQEILEVRVQYTLSPVASEALV